MDTVFPFHSLLIFGFLSIMLLIGIFLRAKIKFIQKFLFPSCLIGGVLGMFIVNSKVLHIDPSSIETFAYHLFNISFISIGLTRSENNSNKINNSKEAIKGPLWMALIQGTIFPLQALVGGLAVLIFMQVGWKLFPTFGFLVPLGFIEGPGQALSFGKVWESNYGFIGGSTIGLTFASIGFFIAFFVGVPLANWGIRKGYSTYGPKKLPQDFFIGLHSKNQEKEKAGELTVHSSNVDTLSFHAAMIGITYVITYFLVKYVGIIFGGDVAKMLWGFFFIFGLCTALIIRWIMSGFKIDYLIDPGVQRRITGWSVDYLIVATVAAIQVMVIWKYFFPIIIISLLAGIMTTVVIFYFGRRLPEYNLERILSIFGVATGTVPSGLLLLRIVDPDFKTPAALELGAMNIIVIPIILLCLILVNSPLWWNWNLSLTLITLAGIMFTCVGLIKLFKLWEEPKF